MLELVYNEETKEWEQKPEPYVTIDVATKEDYDFLRAAVAFYEKHTAKDTNVLTNADRIRAMSDEELVEMLYNGVDAEYCRNAPECGEMLDADHGIPEEKCKGCLLNWLRQPVKEA